LDLMDICHLLVSFVGDDLNGLELSLKLLYFLCKLDSLFTISCRASDSGLNQLINQLSGSIF
jgi:hypothetical protein